MKTSKFNEQEVVKQLNRKNDAFVDDKRKIVNILTEGQSNDLGIHSRGKIDFLVNHCGYWKYTCTQKSFTSAKIDYKHS